MFENFLEKISERHHTPIYSSHTEGGIRGFTGGGGRREGYPSPSSVITVVYIFFNTMYFLLNINIFIIMSMKLIKRKLARRGKGFYERYFFNNEEILTKIIKSIDNGESINEDICEVIFETKEIDSEQIYELIMYYPNKLKEKKYIDDEFIKDLYNEYGETINIMKLHPTASIRGRLTNGANYRAKQFKLDIDINSEDIKLVKYCPYLNIELKYNNIGGTDKYSPSLDKIDPSKGYIKGNIQVISMLANQMKSSADITELLTFSNNIIKLYS